MLPIPEGLAYLGLISVLGLFGAIVVKTSPFYQKILCETATGRFLALDGLRGVLALSVFVHHCAYFSSYYRGDGWILPRQSLSFMAGSVSVSIFFMITGFLFWSKAIAARGQIRLWALYRSRFMRLYPMFLCSFLAILFITAIRTNGTLNERPSQVVMEALQWLLVGIAGFPNLNGIASWTANAGVTWTLQYEAWFYLSLPFLAPLLWRFGYFAATFVLFVAMFPFAHHYINYPNLACFILGAGTAYCVARYKDMPWRKAMSAATICCCILLCWGAYNFPPFTWRFIAFPLFLAILYGFDVAGMLVSNAWRALGTMSYSIYLLHGTVLYVGLGLIDRVWRFRALSNFEILVSLVGCAAMVVFLSSLTYRFIEHPFLTRRSAVPPPDEDSKLAAAST